VAVRPTAALSLFLLLNISAGSFFNPSMPPFILAAMLFMATPSGQWLGLDKHLHAKYPESIWFK
jgi:thiosulfate dehydrogenase [quinone] large subunit